MSTAPSRRPADVYVDELGLLALDAARAALESVAIGDAPVANTRAAIDELVRAERFFLAGERVRQHLATREVCW